MPSEVSLVGGDQSVEQLSRELAETREQLTATNEILGVISNSATNVQPVFDTIAERAMRLCSATRQSLTLSRGEGKGRRV